MQSQFKLIINMLATAVSEQVIAYIQAMNAKQSQVKNDNDPMRVVPMREVCKMFSVTPMTLGRWHKAGKLKKHHVGQKVFYLKSDIEQLINEKGGVVK
ncbi:helix-turn-helix domain-containing protein [Sodaliphilus pleomorphus]|uniref:helix-turn-helix domain-containing protein n=1 Tax=Sodaliphilus pleomorphus TaxID=2606626 RepID=UPI0024098BD1|nr:helix-turn-helix domain-containing protein [Sodaliphilus pleomorphus]MDD6687371.1 helix-turn-helix domain-containing protein [Sodaliphilus pleomorphus]